MNDLGARIIMFTNTSPIFKGLSVMIAGLIALGFWYYMKKRWSEPESAGFTFFLWFSVFVILYGLFILVVRPGWWKLPY